ncbi:hypothetical protein F2Q70_00041313 [Brassica cretica]|uniref:Uncharacterized protein n=1 Tax=Brassica cretica TaxID=69181 RepID=A0A3N6QV10_BRACR|nr:hypothetical protein F2Q70_00041313 [Brassica cretica]KAF3497144.1 hypothetical protein DY000_02057000 [Brassica cretica]
MAFISWNESASNLTLITPLLRQKATTSLRASPSATRGEEIKLMPLSPRSLCSRLFTIHPNPAFLLVLDQAASDLVTTSA